MSYEVTATRRRPRTFDGLVGQEFVVATLKNSLESGRIAHAYLFAGPRGVGKTSAARILAKALNCPDGPSVDGCEDWDGADEIARGTALDVIEIDGASNTSVNDVRQIKDEVLFAPNSSRYKIYIIDEVHMLSNSAFNALLKTIEEPPPYIIFIFATTEIHKVPATIRSRCQQFNFRLIPLDRIRESLSATSTELGVTAEEDALSWIAKEATGSLRDAYTLYDQVIAFSDNHISLDLIHEKLGLLGMERLNVLLEAVVGGNVTAVLEIVEEALLQGVSVERFTIDLADYLRTLLLIKNGVTRESVIGITPDRIPESVRAGLTREQLETANEIVLQLYRDLRYSVNQRFDLELTLSRLANLRNYLAPQELVTRIESLQHELIHSASHHVRENDEIGREITGRTGSAAGDAAPAGSGDATGDAAAAGSGASADIVEHTPTERSRRMETRDAPPEDAHAGSPDSAVGDAHAGTPGAAAEDARVQESAAAAHTAAAPAARAPTAGAPATGPPTAGPEVHSTDASAGDEPTGEAPTGDVPTGEASAEDGPTGEAATGEALTREASAGDGPTGEAATGTPPALSGIQEEQVHAIIARFRTQRISVAAILSGARSWQLEAERLVIGFADNFAAHALNPDRETVRDAVRDVLGEDALRVEFQVEHAEAAPSGTDTPAEHVEMVRRVFRGEIVEETK